MNKKLLDDAIEALGYITGCSAPMTPQQEQCWPVMEKVLTALRAERDAQADPLEKLTREQERLGLYDDQFAQPAVTISRADAEAIRGRLSGVQDEGPDGEGWQSTELMLLVARLHEAIATTTKGE